MNKGNTTEELLLKISQLMDELAKKDEIILGKDNVILEKNEELRIKDEKILILQRQIYGRRSEKRIPEYNPAQLTIFSFIEGDETLEEEKDILITVVEEVQQEAEKRREITKAEKKHITRTYKIPANIRREECILEPENVDLSSMSKIGEDITERLMYKPAEFWVKRIIRPVYKEKKSANPESTTTPIFQHPQLQNILPGCMADNSLISQIIIDKFQYHLPENRQKERFKSLGIDITPSTINRWVHKVADKLYFLYKLQIEDVLNCDYIQVDETTQQIADRVGKTRKGYVWLVRNVSEKTVFYYYKEGSRSQETILKLLKNYQGALQTDGYAAYSIYEGKQGVLPLGCMAHVRRKFENALATTSEAQVALDYIALLYTIEANLKARNASVEEIRKEREHKSYPILRAFEEWMVQESTKHTPKSLMRKAIEYAFGMWVRISRYCKDGRYDIDNNAIERAVRPVTLGRKNYLFSAHDKGAEDNAIFYTFITTCKELGVEPLEWFNHVFGRITDNTTEEEMRLLLPKNFKLEQE